MGILARSPVLAAVVVAIWAAGAVAQISPGELAEPHASLEGMKKCLSCHKLGAGPSEEKCLECHKEIAVRMEKKKGFHHVATNVNGKACFECHGEHAGRDFQLIVWPAGRDNFDHAETGWQLEGAHQKAKCRDCHNEDHVGDDLKEFKESVNMQTTFLGLVDACRSCHADEHRGQMKEDCARCHTSEKWKPAPSFDHNRAGYRLTGAHSTVKCEKCHKPVRDPKPWDRNGVFTRYKPVAHENCTPCHKDVHAGKFGADCASCHQTSAWKNILADNFDHSRTQFPLKGRHARVECDKCHTKEAKTNKLAFAACTDCHRDIHDGQFAARKDGGRCESCHDVNGFRPALFTVSDHARSRFPLEGAHLAQPCVACHTTITVSGGKDFVRYRFRNTGCESCHDDVHRGQLKPKACEKCHLVDDWHGLVFNHDRNSSYPLEGEHRGVPCAGCHLRVVEKGQTFTRYKPIDHSCKTCHTQEGLKLRSG